MTQLILFGAIYLYIASIIITIIYFLLLSSENKKGFLIFGGVDLVLTYLIGLLAGKLYLNPRPFVAQHITPLFSHTPDNGFPSDHVLLTASLASIIFCYNKKWGIGLYIIAILVGVSRVLAGVHHWVDVVGALVIAIVVSAIAYPSMKKYFYV